MTAQSVKAQPINLSTVAVKQKVNGWPPTTEFEKVMDKNLKTNISNENKPITRQKAVMAKVKEVVEEVIRENSKLDPDINSDMVSKQEEIGLVGKVISEKETLFDETDDELLIPEDQLLEILGSIQQAIMDVLNIDMDQLDKQMDALGIVTGDLLNPDTLRQLVLTGSGKSEVTAFLTDENLARSVNELIEKVDIILSEADVNLSEDEITALAEKQHNIETMNKQDENLTQNAILHGSSVKNNTLEQLRTEQASNTRIDNKLTDTIESVAHNEVQTRELELAQTDQDDNNSNEMNPKNQFDGFIDAMINATQKTQQVDFVGNEMQITEFREIANQIIEQIKVTVVQDQSSMELQLNPENLGKVNLSVQSKNGVLTAQFVVNNDIVKEAIESQMIVLKDSLEQQGLKVETIEVTVANYSFDQRHESNSSGASKEQQDTRRKITFDEAVHMSELPQDEESMDSLNIELGNRIDYTA